MCSVNIYSPGGMSSTWLFLAPGESNPVFFFFKFISFLIEKKFQLALNAKENALGRDIQCIYCQNKSFLNVSSSFAQCWSEKLKTVFKQV